MSEKRAIIRRCIHDHIYGDEKVCGSQHSLVLSIPDDSHRKPCDELYNGDLLLKFSESLQKIFASTGMCIYITTAMVVNVSTMYTNDNEMHVLVYLYKNFQFSVERYLSDNQWSEIPVDNSNWQDCQFNENHREVIKGAS